jgi:ubiquinol-cytochrome c reductase cytochrome c1 subunit
MRKLALVLMLAAAPGAFAAEESAEGHGAAGYGADWQHWEPANEVDNVASLQRGARNFFGYCAGCHSLKYVRYSRLGEDLTIPQNLLEQYVVPATAKSTDYVMAAMPGTDAEAWFGKAPPDLSLIARSRGTDYLYQFLRTFYVDPSKPTGVNNLRLDGTAMPHVLADLEGLKRAVFKNVEHPGEGGQPVTERVFDHFEEVSPGQLSREEYDAFVRDLVNFLDYVGEPTQVDRRALGVWVILFLLVFTWLAWLLKKDYWKDVH